MNLDVELIGISKFIKKLRNDLPKMAKQENHFFLLGEKGVGKTTFAKLIHKLSGKGELSILNANISNDNEIKETLQLSFSGILIQDIEEFFFFIRQ